MTAYRIVLYCPRAERQDRKRAALEAAGIRGRQLHRNLMDRSTRAVLGFREFNRSAIKMDL
jgi:hypothetical protein